jgi:hypothetical protein
MKAKRQMTDPDILDSMAAVQRAAKRAKQIAKATGTPWVVVRTKKSNARSRPKGRTITNSNPTRP